MKAIVYERFGSADQLRCEEIDKPSPGEGEVLVRVHAASVNPLDWHMVRGTPRLIRLSAEKQGKWMRPGRDVAGVVESVGTNVTRLRPGDAVFGACQGAFADYVCGPQSAFAAKPPSVSFEEAAAVPIAGSTALQGLRDSGRLRAGQRVLINGAGGGVGTFAVQLARLEGAEVTAVCSASAAALVRSLGADRVIDYAQRDFTGGGDRYDLILDLVGSRTYRAMKRILAPDGRIVAVGGGGRDGRRLGRWLGRTLLAVLASRLSRRKVFICMSKLDLADLDRLGALVAEGKLRPAIEPALSTERGAGRDPLRGRGPCPRQGRDQPGR